jgi:glucan biosynthesis protein C
MLIWLPLLLLGGALGAGGISVFSGGLTWQSAGLCLWEALICIGMNFGVLAGFRRWAAGQSRVSKWMSDNAFAVYVVHAPILVGLALLLAPVTLAPIAKFALLWALGAVVTFGLAAPLARRIPWIGRVLQ